MHMANCTPGIDYGGIKVIRSGYPMKGQISGIGCGCKATREGLSWNPMKCTGLVSSDDHCQLSIPLMIIDALKLLQFGFFFSKLAARALDVLGDVHLNCFHAIDFGSSEHSKEKVYEVCILSGLAQYPLELELPVISVGPDESDF